MQLFKFHSGGILSHSWKGSHGPTCGVLHRSGIFHHQCLNQGTQKRNSWPPTAKRDPELGELPKSRPQAPRLQVFQGAELRFVFVSWTIFCICRGDTATHPMFAAAKGREVVADTGDLQSRGTGGQHAIFLGRVFSVAGHAFNESKFQIFTDLAPEANAELPSEVPTPLPAPVHPAGLPVGGIFTPPPLLCGRCLLF
jgi:hypothetical protein